MKVTDDESVQVKLLIGHITFDRLQVTYQYTNKTRMKLEDHYEKQTI